MDHMITKLPEIANRVITSTGCKTRRRRGQRGIALVSVIAVLVLLAMVATPFLMTMRDSRARGEKFLYGQRADAEAEALFDTVRSQLIGGLAHVERRKLDAMGPTGNATNQAPAGDATPNYDTPEEMTLPQSVLDGFNQANAKEHRVWSADIVDTQTLFNLNNCSYPILANILGRTEVAGATKPEALNITLTHVPENFPKQDGVVRIGSECIRYKTIVGNDLVSCDRGFMQSSAGNGPAHDLEMGDVVMLESCFQVATRPFRLRPPAWVRYTHVDQARTISDMGVAALAPEDYERLRPFVTAWNGNAVGDGWSNPQRVKNGITAHQKENLYAQIKNLRYFGPGTMVQITDGSNYDYAIVTKIQGNDHVLIAGDITHDYQSDQTRIYSLSRSPINVNTADIATLSLVFDGLRLRGKTAFISTRTAQDLAAFLKTWTPKPIAGVPMTPGGKPGVFRDWEDFTRALEDAKIAGKLDDDALKAVLLNALNANDSQLAFSTVPFVFASYDIYEVRATASIQGSQGRELARREIRRVMEVSTTKSGTFVLESQNDFENQIIKTRDAKYMMTFPVAVASYDPASSLNIPASEYPAFAQKNLFPSTDRTVGVGYVQLAPASFRYGQSDKNRVDHVQHFDQERIPDGFELKEKGYTFQIESPYAPEKGTLDLVDTESIDSFAENIELGIRDFAVSFWYRPDWDRGGADQYIFDYGNDADDMDRVSLRYDQKDDALVLACADATREKRQCEVRYHFDHGTWVSKEWYHIACHVGGCSPALMQLFVDAQSQGHPAQSTRLTSAPPSTGGGEFDLQVDQSDGYGAKYFPDAGCLILRAKDGVELMEYTSKTENSFHISRRKARTIVHAPVDTTPRTHQPGEAVELYGFTGPLLTDVTRGGASTVGSLGAWRAYRFICTGDTLEIPPTGTPPKATFITRGLSQPTQSGQKQPDVTLQDWDTGSTDANIFNDLGSVGSEGVAMLISKHWSITNGSNSPATLDIAPGNTQGTKPTYTVANDPQSADVGGVEFVRYTVGPNIGHVTITARNLQLRHMQGKPGPSDGKNRFMPTYSFNDTNQDPLTGEGTYGAAHLPNSTDGSIPGGAQTAFIPIAVVAAGGNNAKYIDPQDGEPQLGYRTTTVNNAPVTLAKAYVQIDGEWIAYDTFDQNTSGSLLTGGHVAFYRDMTIDDVIRLTGTSGDQSFGGANATIQYFTSTPAQSYGVAGGTGGNAPNDEPAPVTDKNLETDAPYAPTSVGQVTTDPPSVTMLQIAKALDFRGYENRTKQDEYRIANTIPPSPAKIHAIGATIMPTFAVVTGNALEMAGVFSSPDDGARYAAPGFNDLITLRDVKGNDDQVRLQWGFLQHGINRYMGWCGPATTPTQTWGWDRPQTTDHAYALQRWDARAFTRAIKFPSGELPDSALTKAKPDFGFGKKYDGTGAVSAGTIDEVAWYSNFKRSTKDRPNYAFLGAVPQQVIDPVAASQTQPSGTGSNANLPNFIGIVDDKVDEFDVHMGYGDTSGYHANGLPIDANTFPPDGGVLKIDEELILYQQFDATSGKFTGCKRGAFGTTANPHDYEAFVSAVWAFPCSQLMTGIDTTSGSYELKDASDFPDDGYFRVGLSSEVIGYTDWNVNNNLTGPLGRIDPTAKQYQTTDTSKKVGGAIFRGRFGTIPAAANQGDLVIAMPFRVYDRYAEHADDPEQSYLELSWTKHGAIWKRITWDADPIKFVEVVALVRFSGGPAWDADKIIHVGQEPIPTEDRRKWLYQIVDPKAENLLNVEADRVEVRIGIRYDKGAFDPYGTAIAPDYWKESPQIRKMVVEYVAPPQVLTQE
jgi:hypothetical protein